jgi:thiosulfate/3-mercaptopyruvate sulfurtransferase
MGLEETDMSEPESDLLVSTDWLAVHLDHPEFVLIDAGEAVAYRRAHIPGAAGVPHPYLKSAANGRLVMSPEEFQAYARAVGVSDDTPVVIYDDNASLHAARVWWVFRHYGHRDVRVVDGGFNAWLDEGRPITSLPPHPEPGSFTARRDASVVMVADDLKTLVESGAAPALWDTRAPDEWDGTNDRGNARVGRVPGARHREWRGLMQGPPARRFRPLSGIRGAFGHFVLTMLGNDRVRNYDGSMGEWANREDTPLTLE